MKIFLLLMAIAFGTLFSAQVGINTVTPQGALDVVSSNSGLIPPRVADTSLTTIPNPVPGMMVYDNSSQCMRFYQNTTWTSCMGAADIMVSDYKLSAQPNDHNGWLVCDGRQISRTTYATLFSIIGTNFGTGDGSTTFNLPDLRGKVVGATGPGLGLTNRALGTNVGAENHTLTQAEMPNYTITTDAKTAGTPSGTISSGGSHAHTVYGETAGGVQGSSSTSGDTVLLNGDGQTNNQSTSTNGAHTHTFTGSPMGTHFHTLSTGGSGNAHNIMQPTLFAGNYFIYTGV